MNQTDEDPPFLRTPTREWSVRAKAAAAMCAASAIGAVALVGIGAGGSSADVATPTGCPKSPVTSVPHPGGSDRLVTGTPVSATLCHFVAVADSPLAVHPLRLQGTQWKSLLTDLVAGHRKSPDDSCMSTKVSPAQLLVLHFTDRSDAELLIDLSGCATVTNGRRTNLLPASLRAVAASAP